MEQSQITANPETATFTINGFSVLLTLTETSLSIHAEHITTSKNFRAIITPENVRNLTSNLFPDLEALYLGLMDAFELSDSSTSVNLSDNGTLTYSWERVLREKKKISENFVITLEEQVQPRKASAFTEDEGVARRFTELEKRTEVLERENISLKADLEKIIMEKLEGISGKIIEQVQETVTQKAKELLDKKVSTLRHEAVTNVKNNLDQVKKLEEEIKKQSQKIAELEEKIISSIKRERKPSSDSDMAIGEKIAMMETVTIPKIIESNEAAIRVLDQAMMKRMEVMENILIPKVLESSVTGIRESEEALNKKILNLENEVIPKVFETNTVNIRKVEEALRKKILAVENDMIPEVRNFNYIAINTIEDTLSKRILAIEILKIPKVTEAYTAAISESEVRLINQIQAVEQKVENQLKELNQTPGYNAFGYAPWNYSSQQYAPNQSGYAPQGYAPPGYNPYSSNKKL